MEQWTRASVACLCGYCGAFIDKDVPIRLTIIVGIKKNRIRGQCCAGPAPPDLPARIERNKIELRGFTPIVRASPHRTRGALRRALAEWMPYKDTTH